ncbi:uncharacterized protein LOC143250688 [Tachypleus tridentatus]|uniref:uncharacterized protein LOC143250688 n=1 Tax=Tachypleus tridentatus TaxID=6853 RepID=UPI003FD2AAB0
MVFYSEKFSSLVHSRISHRAKANIVMWLMWLQAVTSVFQDTSFHSSREMSYVIRNPDGTYKYGYNTGSGPSQSFRHEEKAYNGTVRGRWGYINPYGYLKVTEYEADDTGYHIIRQRTVQLKVDKIVMYPPRPVEIPYGPFIGPLPPFIHRPTSSFDTVNKLT